MGAIDGIIEGATERPDEGIELCKGALDGCEVGSLDGSILGCLDGAWLGFPLGTSDLNFEGKSVGIPAGACVQTSQQGSSTVQTTSPRTVST